MYSIPRLVKITMAALPAIALMACTSSSVPQMNSMNMAGDDFNHQLARNYKASANFEDKAMFDTEDADLYAKKSILSANGKPTNPDNMAKREIADTSTLPELRNAHARLTKALAGGAARTSPVNAAAAQANYDCWVEQQEEGYQHDHIAACKAGFWRAMNATETAMAPTPAQPRVAMRSAAPAKAAPAEAQAYQVFFDWDGSALSDDAREVLNQAIARNRATGHGIHLVGNTDASGTDAYNMGLSNRRAASVASYLTSKGVASGAITSEGRGERDPLIATNDGAREPQNRRVSIELSTQTSGR